MDDQSTPAPVESTAPEATEAAPAAPPTPPAVDAPAAAKSGSPLLYLVGIAGMALAVVFLLPTLRIATGAAPGNAAEAAGSLMGSLVGMAIAVAIIVRLSFRGLPRTSPKVIAVAGASMLVIASLGGGAASKQTPGEPAATPGPSAGAASAAPATNPAALLDEAGAAVINAPFSLANATDEMSTQLVASLPSGAVARTINNGTDQVGLLFVFRARGWDWAAFETSATGNGATATDHPVGSTPGRLISGSASVIVTWDDGTLGTIVTASDAASADVIAESILAARAAAAP